MIDVAKLEAGPELDVLIGKMVMGCRVVKRREGTFDLIVPGDVASVDWVEEVGAWSGMPKYSTNIASAQMIVHELRRRGFDFKMEQSGAHHYQGSNGRFTVFNEKTKVSFTCHNAVCNKEKGPGVDWHGAAGGNGHGAVLVEADTAPLAICRAALKAAGA